MDLLKEERILRLLDKKVSESNLQKRMSEVMNPDWYNILKTEFDKEYFINLSKIIHRERSFYKIYPENIDKIFQVFKNTNPFRIKVVIIGQDPYPDGSYDGRAFSNSVNKVKISPSLKNIFKEIENDIYDGFKVDQDPNLKRWEDQGVMLINRVLTVRHGRPRSHKNIGWENFTGKVISTLSIVGIPKVFMLWGNDAKSLEKIINEENNLILKTEHPSPLSVARGGWFGNKHFSKANEFLEKNNLTKINW